MQIIESLEKIAEAIEKSNSPDRLWTIEDISVYIGYHINFVYQLKDKPNFPRPIQLGKHPRWLPLEIKDWVKKQRG